MKLNIVSWNVRGLNSARKRVVIKNILKTWKQITSAFQETKVEGEITDIIREAWGNRWINYAQLEASRTRGGIVIIWDKKVWEGGVSSVGIYSVTCNFTGKSQEFKWHLTGVYAPNDRVEREETWWEIGAARGLVSRP